MVAGTAITLIGVAAGIYQDIGKPLWNLWHPLPDPKHHSESPISDVEIGVTHHPTLTEALFYRQNLEEIKFSSTLDDNSERNNYVASVTLENLASSNSGALEFLADFGSSMIKLLDIVHRSDKSLHNYTTVNNSLPNLIWSPKEDIDIKHLIRFQSSDGKFHHSPGIDLYASFTNDREFGKIGQIDHPDNSMPRPPKLWVETGGLIAAKRRKPLESCPQQADSRMGL